MTVPMAVPVTGLAALPTGAARRVVYLGTPEVAVPPLQALVAAGVEIALVVTRPDKRRGRGSGVSPSPVKIAAVELGLPVSHDLADVLTVGADLGVVVAYGSIIPISVLAQVAMINVHFSLLPRWRGAAPVERALLAGDTQTGVCIMRVEEGLDTGVVYERIAVAIRSDHSLTSLRNELVQASLPALLRVVTEGVGTGTGTHGTSTGTAQQGEPTHAAKISPSELQVQFTMSVREVVARTKLEAAWFVYLAKRVRVLQAKPSPNPLPAGSAAGDVLSVSPAGVEVVCGDGVVLLIAVQPEGKNAMSAVDWANGARLGTSLTVASLA